MRTDVPVCKRCCFCVPLRYGLLTWGYFKLIGTTILTILLITTLIYAVNLMIRYGGYYRISDVVILSIMLFMMITEIVLNTLFVVGGHMKNVKLLRIYYIYNLVIWGLSIALFLFLVCKAVPTIMSDNLLSYRPYLYMIDFSTYFVNIVIHSYFLLLLRSEIIKLNNNCEFQFSNNAAEAECTMKYSQRLVGEEMGTEDDCEEKICGTGVCCQKICQSNGTCHKNEDLN